MKQINASIQTTYSLRFTSKKSRDREKKAKQKKSKRYTFTATLARRLHTNASTDSELRREVTTDSPAATPSCATAGCRRSCSAESRRRRSSVRCREQKRPDPPPQRRMSCRGAQHAWMRPPSLRLQPKNATQT
jgi:hypothetical protein